MTRLEKFYRETVAPSLQEQFSYKSAMEVPRLTKITLNMGIGEASVDKKVVDAAVNDMSLIAGQKPVVTLAKKAIAGFKIREGMPIGVKVTLRRDNMFEFLDRLVNFAIPRIRDFRGLSPKSFDGRGNFSMGITDQTIFTEVNLDKMKHTIGMNINIVTTASTNAEGLELLTLLGVPFKKA